MGDPEYHLNSNNTASSPSTHSSCQTPQDEVFPSIEGEIQDNNEENLGKVLPCESPLGAGYGVDGEYDDYLEYLKGSLDDAGEVKKIEGSRAWGLDCEGGRIVEV